jgi:NitT/TauT family transport system ATP-binding protein
MTDVGTELAVHLSAASKVFDRAGGLTLALEDVSLAVEQGEFVCLLGPSGCGKSTLLHLIASFILPDSGEVRVMGKVVHAPGADRSVLFQSPALFPWLNSLDNVLFGPRAQSRLTESVRTRALDLLRQVGLSGFERHYPHQLSGGMRHRLAFARALINNPPILLMDEPFGALDAITRRNMQELLLEIWQQHPMTILFVTHDVEEAALLADRVLVMSPRPGRIVEQIAVGIKRPRNLETTETMEFIDVRRRIRMSMEGLR